MSSVSKTRRRAESVLRSLVPPVNMLKREQSWTLSQPNEPDKIQRCSHQTLVAEPAKETVKLGEKAAELKTWKSYIFPFI